MAEQKVQIGDSLMADFEDNTWTFEMEGKFVVRAGRYAIIPEAEYRRLLALSNDAIELFKLNVILHRLID